MFNRFVKLKAGLMVTVILVSIVPQVTYANLHTGSGEIEVASSWARDEVEKAMEVGLVSEGIQGSYREDITREEISELAVDLYEQLSRKRVRVQIDNPFLDTSNPKAIIARQLGIMNGKSDEEFDPEGKITREEVSLVLYNTLRVAKPKYNYEEDYPIDIKDSHLLSTWAKDAVEYLYAIEVLNGNDENLLKPKEYTKKEDGIILAKRLYDKVVESERTSRGGLAISKDRIAREDDSKERKLQNLIAGELGKPYQWGATGPHSYDCSGFTYSIFGKMGIQLGRSSRDQIHNGLPVAKKDLQYGDLVLFAGDGKNISHVGIYVGNGKFAHSPRTGDVVKITTLETGYYANTYYAARRLL